MRTSARPKLSALLLAFVVAAPGARQPYAAPAPAPPPQEAGQRALLDTTPPTVAVSISSSYFVGTTELLVDFAASDEESSVAGATLYVRTPAGSAFVNTGLSLTGDVGTFVYEATDGNGRYEFAIVATDTAGNSSAVPTTAGAFTLLNVVANSPFTSTTRGGTETLLFPMHDDVVVSLTLQGATPGATITVSRQTPVRGSAPAFLRNPSRLLNERLTITATGLGPGATATLYWPYVAENLPPGQLDRVWSFASPDSSSPTVYPLAPAVSGGAPLRIPGITSFSEWYAGEQSAELGVGNAFVLR